jgi:hypothetical protein
MSRTPIVELVQASLRVPRGREAYWRLIREIDAPGPWSLRDVVMKTNSNRRTVSAYIELLRRGGYVRVVDSQPTPVGVAYRYRLTKRPGDAPRLADDGSELPEPGIEQMWRAMKMAKTFSVAQLAEACPGTAYQSVRNYVGCLYRAGVLSLVRKQTPVSPAQYGLIRNLGHRAPKILAARVVFDPNAKIVLGKADAREVSP